MTEHAEPGYVSANVVSQHNSVPLEAILCTDELKIRPARSPDHRTESRALVALAEALSESPHTVLQTLADTILDVCRAGSAGVSLLTKEDGGKRFYWPAIAGKWKAYIGGGTPRDFGPCGDVLDRNSSLLMRHIERRYTYFQPVRPAVQEALLVPFYVQGKAVGTIWAVTHNDRKFDSEDERLLKSLGKFASSAYQTLESLDALTIQAHALETQVHLRTQELEERNSDVLAQTELLRELSNRLLQTQDEERRRIARDLHDSVGQIVTALGMHLAAITQDAVKPKVRKVAEECNEMVQQLSTEIRTVSYLLHPPLLDETGLSEAIHWYMKGIAERSGLKIILDIPRDFGRLPVDMEVAIFRIIQECLTNIHRHAKAKTATLNLSRNIESVYLVIRDDGIGISATRIDAVRDQRSGVGITGIRERVRYLNGILKIQSSASGTEIRVDLPMIAATQRSYENMANEAQN